MRGESARRFALLALGAVAVAAVALCAFLVRQRSGFVVDTDRSVENAAHRAVLGSPALLAFARDVTHVGDPLTRWIIAGVVVAVLALRRMLRTAAFFAAAFAGGLLLVTALKAAVDRARPVLSHPVAHASGTSFPSGHAMGSTVVYGGVLLVAAPFLRRGVRALAATLVVLLVAAVCASRVLLGVHYLSDVVAGILLGSVWLAAVAAGFGVAGRRRSAGRAVPERELA